ncbi:MAG TPA: alpha/beta hydrolase [Burkholderiales bacterium]|nr:alpha/beta hydrolase [Burkholderiales bacterium]
MRLLLAALLACAAPLHAQELVTLPTRPGVTLSFFIANMGKVQPRAAALMLIGGGGNIRLRMEGGKVHFGQQNFLPRTRREFIAQGILPVILDNPTDQQAGDGMTDDFRAGAKHTEDLRAVLAEVKRRHPGLPVFLVGTSRSTLSAAYQARALGDALAGAVLSSSMFRTREVPVLAVFDFASIRIPFLFVHHRADACHATPYYDAERLGRKYPLVSVSGGKPPETGPCDPLSAHGYFGKEAETVAAIAAWMLGRPFDKEIN